jgi:hypothetical protein
VFDVNNLLRSMLPLLLLDLGVAGPKVFAQAATTTTTRPTTQSAQLTDDGKLRMKAGLGGVLTFKQAVLEVDISEATRKQVLAILDDTRRLAIKDIARTRDHGEFSERLNSINQVIHKQNQVLDAAMRAERGSLSRAQEQAKAIDGAVRLLFRKKDVIEPAFDTLRLTAEQHTMLTNLLDKLAARQEELRRQLAPSALEDMTLAALSARDEIKEVLTAEQWDSWTASVSGPRADPLRPKGMVNPAAPRKPGSPPAGK